MANQIETFVSTVEQDVISAAKTVEVDTVYAVEALSIVLNNLSTDLKVGGLIISVVDPALSSTAISITNILGNLQAIFGVLDNLSQALSNPATMAADYAAIQKDIQNGIAIFNAQKAVIEKDVQTIMQDALQFENPLNTILKNL
jgi:hypothetical protein